MLTATVVQSGRTCERFGCRCHRGEKHIGTRVTLQEGGKVRSVYVLTQLVGDVQQWAAEAHRLKRLLTECSQLTIAPMTKRAWPED